MSKSNNGSEILSREEFMELYNILLFLNIDAGTETDPAIRRIIQMAVECLETAYAIDPTSDKNDYSYAVASTPTLNNSNGKDIDTNKNIQHEIPFYTSKEPLLKKLPSFRYLNEAIDQRVHILSPISESPAQTHRSDSNDELLLNQDILDLEPIAESSHTDNNCSSDEFEQNGHNSSKDGSLEELSDNDECFAVVAHLAPRKALLTNLVKESKVQKLGFLSNSTTDNNMKDSVSTVTEPQSPNTESYKDDAYFSKLLNPQIPSNDDGFDDPELCNSKGNELSNIRNFREALIYYTKAMQLNPKEPVYTYNRAMAYFELNVFLLCVRDLKEVIQMDVNNAVAYNALGNAYYQMYEFRKAEREYTQALKFEPDNDEYKQNLLFVQKTINEDF